MKVKRRITFESCGIPPDKSINNVDKTHINAEPEYIKYIEDVLNSPLKTTGVVIVIGKLANSNIRDFCNQKDRVMDWQHMYFYINPNNKDFYTKNSISRVFREYFALYLDKLLGILDLNPNCDLNIRALMHLLRYHMDRILSGEMDISELFSWIYNVLDRYQQKIDFLENFDNRKLIAHFNICNKAFDYENLKFIKNQYCPNVLLVITSDDCDTVNNMAYKQLSYIFDSIEAKVFT